MNCSTSSRSNYYNTHLYHPYSRNSQPQHFAHESTVISNSFNQQLGINCSTNQLNEPNSSYSVTSSNYSGLLTTISSNSLTKQDIYNTQIKSMANSSTPDYASLNNSTITNLNDHQNSNQTSLSNHLNRESNLNNQSDYNQLNQLTCLSNIGIQNNLNNLAANNLINNSSANFTGENDEIDFIISYISSSDEQTQKVYSNQNDLTMINKENHSQFINNCQVSFFELF